MLLYEPSYCKKIKNEKKIHQDLRTNKDIYTCPCGRALPKSISHFLFWRTVQDTDILQIYSKSTKLMQNFLIVIHSNSKNNKDLRF
jgi:hypothetical protein